MTFWILAAIMTFAACVAVILPFLRSPKAGSGERAHDLEVYADQLREVDRDLARGVIGADEADEARAELGRRILKLADDGDKPAVGGRGGRRAASFAALIVPFLAWGIYGWVGSAGMPGQPLQARLEANPEDNTLPELVARAERHLADNPEDARGWSLVAPIYLRIGRAADAVAAYRNAIDLSSTAADLEAGLGEALTVAAGGTITADAVEAFERALAIDPATAKAQFFLAGAMAQEGRLDEARERLNRMIAQQAQDSPWRQMAVRALASLDADAAPGRPGPTMEDMQAANELSSEDRAVMVEGMVDGLARRLEENPDDPDGWIRLVRSYHVLGRADDARSALERGRAALRERPVDAERLEASARVLGVNVTE